MAIRSYFEAADRTEVQGFHPALVTRANDDISIVRLRTAQEEGHPLESWKDEPREETTTKAKMLSSAYLQDRRVGSGGDLQ